MGVLLSEGVERNMMKTDTFLGKRLNTAAAVLIAAVVAYTLTIPTLANAKTLETTHAKTTQTAVASAIKSTCAQTKTVKKCDFSTATAKIEKEALTVKKGLSKLIFKGGIGYLKFTAPATKNYSFRFSNLQSSNSFPVATVSVQKANSRFPESSIAEKMKTNGGISSTLWLDLKSHKTKTFKNYNLVDRPIKTRTGNLSLTQGESVYFFFSGSLMKKPKLDLKIS